MNADVAAKVNSFRNGFVFYIPGGGGNYGKPIICDSAEDVAKRRKETEIEIRENKSPAGQKTLGEF